MDVRTIRAQRQETASRSSAQQRIDAGDSEGPEGSEFRRMLVLRRRSLDGAECSNGSEGAGCFERRRRCALFCGIVGAFRDTIIARRGVPARSGRLEHSSATQAPTA
jgi:hypothetical protein